MKVRLLMLVLALAPAGVAWGRTVAYWQLDGRLDGRDAVAVNGPNYYDLTAFGGVGDAQPKTAGGFAIPNPSVAAWRSEAGDGVAATDSLAQGFSATGAGWYTAEIVEDLRFDRDRSFTAECWFRTNLVTGYMMGNRHASSLPGDYSGWQLWTTAGGNSLMIYADGAPDPNNSSVSITTSISSSTWYHAAVVWDHDDGPTGMLRLYLDGVEVGSAPGHERWSGVTGGHWAIGQRNLWIDENDPEQGYLWGNTGFGGQIDEVRFVDEALTPAYFLNGSTPYVAAGDQLLAGDLDQDRDVDLLDLGVFAEQWLRCSDPGDGRCSEP